MQCFGDADVSLFVCKLFPCRKLSINRKDIETVSFILLEVPELETRLSNVLHHRWTAVWNSVNVYRSRERPLFAGWSAVILPE